MGYTPNRFRRPRNASNAEDVRGLYCTLDRGTSQERSSWPALREIRAFPGPTCQPGREGSLAERMRRPTGSARNQVLAFRLLSSHAPSPPEPASRVGAPSLRAAYVNAPERQYPFRVWRRLPTAARDNHKTQSPRAVASVPAIAFNPSAPNGQCHSYPDCVGSRGTDSTLRASCAFSSTHHFSGAGLFPPTRRLRTSGTHPVAQSFTPGNSGNRAR